jgi:hemerythrin-like metal-binding protein
MAYFEWADDLIIDGGPIDADHRQLVDLVNVLHTATSEGRGVEVIDGILKQVIDYTLSHLQREEALMASVHFPMLENHKLLHKRFADHLQGLKAKYDAGSITVASQLSAVLRDWLSLHIRRSDKELKVFLAAPTAKVTMRSDARIRKTH